ncbi:MFS transporter [Ferrimonas lipolytica]|uniref:MFS transporter n=1 Tax=Ferrimonas lipolytica TaxID=2724191 RepID=A0A6H1UDQ7_9GAMM|nr:MFS transporter [Ferrimonas lipolytica]QIZ77215.1 MFS transporter [Ferrimonas lipolytica]
MSQLLSGRQGKALAACYFFYFAINGLLLPYLGTYFSDLGFDSFAIGQLMSVLFVTRMVAPNLWAYLADKLGHRARFIKMGAFLAALIFSATIGTTAFFYLALILFGYTFFWNGVLPQLEVVTLTSLGNQSHRYGTLRSFGSIGYIVVVLCAGAWFEYHGSSSFAYIGLALFIGLACSSLWVSEPQVAVSSKASSAAFMTVLMSPAMILFLLASILLQASHGPFYTFFVLHMSQLGVGEGMAGVMVAGGVFAEIGIFAIAPRLLARFSLANLLLFTAAITALRWGLTGVMEANQVGQLLVQGLHGISFGLGHACAIQYIHRSFPVADQGKAQALYASVAFGLGGAMGAWCGGLGWQDGAGASATWFGAATAALLALLILLLFRHCQSKPAG